jgi:hypothetical protein
LSGMHGSGVTLKFSPNNIALAEDKSV